MGRGRFVLGATVAVAALACAPIAQAASSPGETSAPSADASATPDAPGLSVDVVADKRAAHLSRLDGPYTSVPRLPPPLPPRDRPAKAEPDPEPDEAAEDEQAEAAAGRSIPDAPSPSGPLGIPERALLAYRTAAAVYGARCALPWQVLAAIGRAESGHAYGGQFFDDGLTWEPILGPVLDGAPFAAIRDTDDGRMDGDRTWDRAVGPMQFIPGTWRWIGVDADGDGSADPHDIDDAAAAAARYLCAHGGDLSDRGALRTAVLRYNNSSAYADTVLAWADAYAGRAAPVADPTPPAREDAREKVRAADDEPAPAPKKKRDDDSRASAPASPRPTASATPTATPAPTAAATPTTSPTPSPSGSAEPTMTAAPSPTSTAPASPNPEPSASSTSVPPSEEASATSEATASPTPATGG